MVMTTMIGAHLAAQQAFVEAQPSRRRVWERLQQRVGEPVPEELEAWWGWSWRDSVVARPVRERMIRRDIAALDRRVSEAGMG